MSESFNETNLLVTTKGDLVGFSTLPVRVAVGDNTQKLVADSTTTAGFAWKDDTQFSVQASDQALADDTLANVTGLAFSMAASTSYFVEIFALLSSTASDADFKFGWTAP